MPTIIDYTIVLNQLMQQGFKSLYHNSGAFGFSPSAHTLSRGWIGREDSSIRASARAIVRQFAAPYEKLMAEKLADVWLESLVGPVWVMPKSHWAYELEFGSREWLPDALEKIGIDSGKLLPLNNAAAIEFDPAEAEQLKILVETLLTRLVGSDFQMVFPDRNTICTIHNRGQLWWTTADLVVGKRLDVLVPVDS
jgi:hypothetical protein